MMHDAEPRHRALARLAIAKRDIEQARTMAVLVMDRIKTVDDPYFQPLFCAMVESYSRPFAQVQNSPGLPHSFSKFGDAHLRAAHDSLLQHSCECTAHANAGWNCRSEEEGSLACTLKGIGFEPSGGTLPLNAFPLIHQLCSIQIERLRQRIDLDTEICTALETQVQSDSSAVCLT